MQIVSATEALFNHVIFTQKFCHTNWRLSHVPQPQYAANAARKQDVKNCIYAATVVGSLFMLTKSANKEKAMKKRETKNERKIGLAGKKHSSFYFKF